LIQSGNHTTRAGGEDRAGRRQSIPSHGIESCAEVTCRDPAVASPPSLLGEPVQVAAVA